MARLILILLIATAIAVALTSALSLVRSVAGTRSRATAGPQKEFPMPGAIQTVAFILLVILMFGVATGLIGGL